MSCSPSITPESAHPARCEIARIQQAIRVRDHAVLEKCGDVRACLKRIVEGNELHRSAPPGTTINGFNRGGARPGSIQRTLTADRRGPALYRHLEQILQRIRYEAFVSHGRSLAFHTQHTCQTHPQSSRVAEARKRRPARGLGSEGAVDRTRDQLVDAHPLVVAQHKPRERFPVGSCSGV